ncbi:hypothetical protein LSTR_LSTR013388 [Laodelphax striatellus]|uniref:Calponin-homology (CH) domain-containing protein n=1 Tax=Laodelphax striatellus TaxID=195883 RepID=A0A482WRJ8_LAOST|nr:hypothetical protein LSTR_LSTR013388 [Laodelphax striatellus]
MLNVRLVGELQVPAVSRTQKIHNVRVALKGYTEHTGNELENGVTAQDIVNGHREKMLSLVWQLCNIREQQAVNVLIGFWRRNADMIKLRMHFHQQRHAAQLIQKWWRRTVIKRIVASLAVVSGDRLRQAFIRMRRAAIVIQRRWRAITAMRVYRERMLQLKEAALLVFFTKRRAAILKMRTDRDNFLRMKSAAIFIQRATRRRLAIQDNNLQEIAQQQRSYYQQLRATTILLQRRWRSLRVQKKNVARRGQQARIENAAVIIQRRWRASALMERDRTAFKNLKTAVKVISERRRSNERLDLDLFNLGLPADLLRKTQPIAIQEKSTKPSDRVASPERIEFGDSAIVGHTNSTTVTKASRRPEDSGALVGQPDSTEGADSG